MKSRKHKGRGVTREELPRRAADSLAASAQMAAEFFVWIIGEIVAGRVGGDGVIFVFRNPGVAVRQAMARTGIEVPTEAWDTILSLHWDRAARVLCEDHAKYRWASVPSQLNEIKVCLCIGDETRLASIWAKHGHIWVTHPV